MWLQEYGKGATTMMAASRDSSGSAETHSRPRSSGPDEGIKAARKHLLVLHNNSAGERAGVDNTLVLENLLGEGSYGKVGCVCMCAGAPGVVECVARHSGRRLSVSPLTVTADPKLNFSW